MLRGFVFVALLVWPVAAFANAYDDFNTGVNMRNRDEYDSASLFLSRALSAPDLPGHLKPVAHLDLGEIYGNQGHFDLAIREYSAAIALSPHDVLGYLDRAGAYENTGQWSSAADDLTLALRERPSFLIAYLDRGIDYERGERFDEADADFKMFLSYAPDSATAKFQLGLTQWMRGNSDAARAQFDSSLKSDKHFMFAGLWSQISRTGATWDPSSLKDASDEFDQKKWPWPIVKLYLGKAKPDETLLAASASDTDTQKDQTCEAQFYVAEYLIAQKDEQGAKPLLDSASSTCPVLMPERRAAALVLKQLVVPATKP
jgi:lipoprotein NlpI